jgi:hypothetical protein
LDFPVIDTDDHVMEDGAELFEQYGREPAVVTQAIAVAQAV